MKDKKAAKLIIQRAKEHPGWYTDQEIRYAKMLKKQLKREKKQHEREVSERNSRSGTVDGVRSESKQSKESGQSKGKWFVRVLHKARSLVSFRAGTYDSRDRDN
tara:strand:- start:46 stop:357 length:312 start_codon:yes stop_codon:yes gene_type:complete